MYFISSTNTGVCRFSARPTMMSMSSEGCPIGWKAVPCPEMEHRDVDRKEPVCEVRQPAQPLERKLDLAHAPREWDSQRRLRGFAENPVGFEAVPELKVSDAVDEHSFVDGGLDATAGVWRQIAECDQQPAQCRDADVRLARFDRRHE